MMLQATEDDVDLDEIITGNPTQLKECERQYRIKIEEFTTFCRVEWNSAVSKLPPEEIFTDERMAKYLGDLLAQFGPGESRRKTTLAALNDSLKKLGKKNLYEADSYPKLNIIIQVLLFIYYIINNI